MQAMLLMIATQAATHEAATAAPPLVTTATLTFSAPYELGRNSPRLWQPYCRRLNHTAAKLPPPMPMPPPGPPPPGPGPPAPAPPGPPAPASTASWVWDSWLAAPASAGSGMISVQESDPPSQLCTAGTSCTLRSAAYGLA